MNYSQALKALESRQEERMELGLARVRAHLKRLGHPERAWGAIHVAGTNGKGSVCAMLDSSLRAAGHKTGLYTSPHLKEPRERIKVGGRPISKKEFARCLTRVMAADLQNRLTYFELLTSVAFLHFRDRRVDVAVLETGLGGRLDATNVLAKPLACVITGIDLDHTALLGTTLSAIAREKAGIIKRGVPIYCRRLKPEVMKVISNRAKAMSARLHISSDDFGSVDIRWRSNQQTVRDASGRKYSIGLLGARQRSNAQLALAVLSDLNHGLGVTEKARAEGLRTVKWPGRFQVMTQGDRTVILDGAHNPEAMRELMGNLENSPWGRVRKNLIIGVLKDKDVAGIVRESTRCREGVFVAVRPESPRALDAAGLSQVIRRAAPSAAVSSGSDVRTALESWRRDTRGPKVAVVCGSFYLIGPALAALRAEGFR